MVITKHTYTMEAASEPAKIAAKHIEEYLHSIPNTIEVVNVENEPNYREMDIDLLWKFRSNDDEEKCTSIEIKGDRKYETGNFFFETISNEQKGTPGCFMYSKADYLFYYFIETELYIIPMNAAREWFIPRMSEFKERKTTTPTGASGEHYNTVGRLIPRIRLIKEVADVRLRPFKNGKIQRID